MGETVAVWRYSGDDAILVSFDGPLEAANASALLMCLRAGKFIEVEEAVPGARTALIRLVPGRRPTTALEKAISQPEPGAFAATTDAPLLQIPVAYDGEDLPRVAEAAGMSVRDVVDTHLSGVYTVGLIGFMPGFPYLLGLDKSLHLPRLLTPRVRVTAGAVAIAGPFTGIYPSPSPGGWHIVGRTELRLFDAGNASRPARLRPGRQVRFVES